MGSYLIEAIRSGLGLVGDLATNFLTGFKNLFVTTASEGGAVTGLTVFGEYAFVMLGISIVFGMIRLCTSLIGSNTGIA